ncbi:uncharacterized protein LOC131881544 [Tigriopus californicus]|uniref:uncharacterized protein LOC131881544 n=1 Tax=Tigriopus californicus TaxID=6832 RepID=UPI0027DA6795|nr:uncharacterized protein LOC131881544 [Tigriopus californicus]|eukprot:TCALIF_11701-PA protein Name:"Protein of unknown function" AED:0.00 eAED:0.00 QI:0/1/0.93/1/0.73/0.75/16/5432/1020
MPLSDLDTPEEGETDEIPPPSAASPSVTRPLASGSLASLASLASLTSLEAPQEPEVLNDEEEFGLPSHVLAIALGDLDEPAEAEADPLGETSAPWPMVLGTVHSLSQDPGLFSQIEVEEDDWSCLEPPARLSASFHHPNVSQDPVGKETLIREAVWEDQRIQCLRLSLPKIDDLAHVDSRGRVDLKRLKRSQPQLFCRRPTRKTTPAAKPKKPRPRAPPTPTAIPAPAPALSAALVQYSSSDSEDSELEALRQRHRPVAVLADHPSPSPRASQAWKRPRPASTPQSEPDPPPYAKRKKTQTGGRPRVSRPPAAVVSHSDDAETVPNPPPVVRDSDATAGERVADSPTHPIHPQSVGRPGVIPPSPGAPPSPPAPSPVPPPIAVPDQLEVNRQAHEDEAWHEPGPLNLAFFNSTHDLRKFKKLLLVELHHHCEFLGKKAPGISFSALERRIQSAMDRIKAQKPLIPARPSPASPASPASPLNGPDQRLRLGAGILKEVRIQLSDVRKVGSLHEKAFQLAWPHFERSLERRARQRQESLSFCLKMIKKFLDTRELYSRAKRESEDKRKDRGRNRKILSDDSESNDDGDKAKSKSNATSQRQDSPDHPGSENAKTKSGSHITQMGKGFKIPKAEGKSKDQSKETTMKSILKEEPMKTNSKGQAPANAKNPLSKQYNHSYQKPRDSNPSRPSANKKPSFSSATKRTQSFDLLNVVSGMKNNTKKKEPRTDPRVRELQNRPQSKNGPHSDTSYQSRHGHNSHIANGKRDNSLGQNKPDRLPLKFIGDDDVDEVLSRRMRDPNGQDFSTVIAWREPGLSPIMFKCRVCNLKIQGKGDLMHHVVGFRHHTNFKRHTALPPRDRPKTALDRPKSALDRPSSSVGDATPPGDDYRDDSPTPGAGQSIEAQPPVMNILPVPSQVWDMPKFSLPLPVPSLPKPVPSTRPSCDSVTPGSFISSTSPMQSSTEATRPRSFIPGLPTPIPVPVATRVPVRNPDSHSPTPAPSCCTVHPPPKARITGGQARFVQG